MVRALASDSKGLEFDSRPLHFQVTTTGKLFAHMCLVTKQYNLVPVKGR